jgi:glycosyltransferase involved in cell wall biosynthesis
MSRAHAGRPELSVLLVTANYRPSIGGIERFVETLAEELARHGHTVRVACCREGNAPLREQAGGVEIVRLRASQLARSIAGVPYPLPSPISLARVLRPLVDAADVVHVQDTLYVTSLAALARARRRGIPCVITQHVGFVPQHNRVLDNAQRLAIRAVGPAARSADCMTAINDTVADWAMATWRVPRPRIFPSGVETPVATPEERAAERRELGLDDSAFVAVFAGRDVAKKHLDTFLAAASPGTYELVAVTDRRRPSAPSTHIVPFRTPESFRRLLASCDAFVLASEGEGFPLALQEALRGGIPCVIARHPGYDRYLDADDAVFVERDADSIREALTRLAGDAGLRQELGLRARAAGDRSFAVEAFASAYTELYEALCVDRCGRSGTR